MAAPSRPGWTTEISVLLKSLALHRSMLEAAHQDAKRLAEFSLSAAYVVDYQLLHRYMFPLEGKPEWIAELDYLFDDPKTSFFVGTGTLLEILHRVRKSTGIDLTAVQVPDYDLYASFIQGAMVKLSDTTVGDAITRALTRLHDLINRPHFSYVPDVSPIDNPDVEAAFLTAFDIFQRIRPGKYFPNIADALNFADVVKVRKTNEDVNVFPYYLTDTIPLLNETVWAHDPVVEAWGFEATITRTPLAAIYSKILLELESNPASAAEYALRLILRAGTSEFNLRSSDKYRSVISERSETFLAERQPEGAPSEIVKQLRHLSDFVSDPLISRAQDLYDASRLAETNWEAVREGTAPAVEPTRRVFDLVIAISGSLSEKLRRGAAFHDVWRNVVKVTVDTDSPGRSTARYCETVKSRRAYLEAEFYLEEKFWIFRWPTALNLEQILDRFILTLAREDAEAAVLHVGLSDQVQAFNAKFPVTLDDLKSALGDASIYWIRFSHHSIDLYADIVMTSEANPIVGVFKRDPDIEQLLDLYEATSSRFLFRSWLREMFEDAISATKGT
ncbi:MAG TPA: hypothetical protein VG318_09500 [Actinomycetota bacterium]|nr:hypothetical protein [Actinomycetota bacterium]